MVTVTVWPGVKPVMLKEKNPCGKTRFGFPVVGRVPSATAVKFSITPALVVKQARPVPVAVVMQVEAPVSKDVSADQADQSPRLS
jgi:hypothetical protein